MATIDVVLLTNSPAYRDVLGDGFTVHEAHEAGLEALQEAVRACARILVTTGFRGVSRAEMVKLPGLGLICCLGTGHENVDLRAARERGVTVTHGAGTNAPAVADHAMGLLLALMRDIPRSDRMARQGVWRTNLGPRPTPTGKHLGILDMGAIGQRIARRAEGFEMRVSFTTRTPRPELPWAHVPTLPELAAQVDHLVVAAPGGAATFHLVDAAVLRALGPQGMLVNVGRGSVVDTQALVTALADGTIAGAALDVFEDEPVVPAALCAMENVVLTPHIAAWSPEVRLASIALLRENVSRFLAGEPVASPVPGMPAQPGARAA